MRLAGGETVTTTGVRSMSLLSALFGSACAGIGVIISALLPNLPSGAVIVVIMFTALGLSIGVTHLRGSNVG